MEMDTDVSILVNNNDIQEIINGLTRIHMGKGHQINIPYGHPDKKTGRGYRYTPSGYELPEYVITSGNLRVIFRNVEG